MNEFGMRHMKTKYQVKCKLKKGDEVIVIAGRSKGSTGKIDSVDLKKGKVYIGAVNLYKKHQKPDMNHPDGGIVDKVVPLDISNVAYYDAQSKKASRIGYKEENGTKVRVSKASGTVLS